MSLPLSVVVIVHNMVREAPRTLYSLSADYQRGISASDYEVLIVENGSTQPLDPAAVTALPGNFRYFRMECPQPSPAAAVNFGLRQAQGQVIGVMIDGARIATPGLLGMALKGIGLFSRAIVATPGWYLGHEFQRESMLRGHDQRAEDALLASIDWPRDGYRLFEVGILDESSYGWDWFGSLAESDALFLRRALWDELKGMDEAFHHPGGGYVNPDTYFRACALPDSELIILLGEGTFHQVHGGIATNVRPQDFERRHQLWAAQYLALRGQPLSRPTKIPTYLGQMPRAYVGHLLTAARDVKTRALPQQIDWVKPSFGHGRSAAASPLRWMTQKARGAVHRLTRGG